MIYNTSIPGLGLPGFLSEFAEEKLIEFGNTTLNIIGSNTSLGFANTIRIMGMANVRQVLMANSIEGELKFDWVHADEIFGLENVVTVIVNSVGITSASIGSPSNTSSANVVLTTSQGSSQLKITGSGSTTVSTDGSTITISSVGQSSGGSNTHVQFNDDGSFTGSAGFTFDKTSNTVTIANTLNVRTINSTSQPLQFIGNSSFDGGVLYIDATNNRVGINNTAPDVALRVTGDAAISGNISFGSISTGALTFANGNFSVAGDAQVRNYILRRQTTDATANVEMFTDGSSSRVSIQANSCFLFDALVVARRTANSSVGIGAAYRFTGAIDNNNGTTAVVGTITKIIIAEDNTSLDCNITANDTNDAIYIGVTGLASNTINWVCYLSAVEVSG